MIKKIILFLGLLFSNFCYSYTPIPVFVPIGGIRGGANNTYIQINGCDTLFVFDNEIVSSIEYKDRVRQNKIEREKDIHEVAFLFNWLIYFIIGLLLMYILFHIETIVTWTLAIFIALFIFIYPFICLFSSLQYPILI